MTLRFNKEGKSDMYHLRTEERHVLPVEYLLVKHSKPIQHLIAATNNTNSTFEVPVSTLDLTRVYEWVEQYDKWQPKKKNDEFRPDNKLKEWEKSMMADLDHDRLISMLDAAMFFQLNDLKECIHLTINAWIHSKSPNELETIFNIKPFTEEEKAKIEAGNKRFWLEQGCAASTSAAALDANTKSGKTTEDEQEVGSIDTEAPSTAPVASVTIDMCSADKKCNECGKPFPPLNK